MATNSDSVEMKKKTFYLYSAFPLHSINQLLLMN